MVEVLTAGEHVLRVENPALDAIVDREFEITSEDTLSIEINLLEPN